jgi:hypothetical protein
MESINILLNRNQTQQDWSIEIDGIQHNHVSSTTLDDLIDYALVAAQQNLLESEDDASSNDTDPTSVPV